MRALVAATLTSWWRRARRPGSTWHRERRTRRWCPVARTRRSRGSCRPWRAWARTGPPCPPPSWLVRIIAPRRVETRRLSLSGWREERLGLPHSPPCIRRPWALRGMLGVGETGGQSRPACLLACSLVRSLAFLAATTASRAAFHVCAQLGSRSPLRMRRSLPPPSRRNLVTPCYESSTLHQIRNIS